MTSESLRRFYIEEINAKDKTCIIAGAEARHITKVLRMKPGDRLVLMDGKGSRFKSLIESVASGQVRVRLEKPFPKPPSSPVNFTLCQAISKPRAMDYLIQKTSELGIDCIAPFFSERTVFRSEGERLANKMRHWREIAKNAAKQCGRALPAKIETPVSFRELMGKWRFEETLKVILWEGEQSNDFKSILKPSLFVKRFVGIVGPEGGFAGQEIDTALEAGFVPVSMGDRVLRAETAAVTMVAIVQYELGDLNLNIEHS